MKTFLEKTRGYRHKLREVEYGPLTDADRPGLVTAREQLRHKPLAVPGGTAQPTLKQPHHP